MSVEGQRRLPIVGVMGSGSAGDRTRCEALGAWLASQRVHLLTGGGRGVMDAVSRGFHETEPRAGLVIGILPASGADDVAAPEGYPNPWVELPIRTHLHLSGTEGTAPASRNHVNVLSSDVVVALPGSWGTRSEVELALSYHTPVCAYLQDRAEIPQLPNAVAVLSDLREVQSFVSRALGRAP